MGNKTFSAKRVWTSKGWKHNAKVTVKDGIITEISEGQGECDIPILIPGMVELHAHGSLAYNSAEPSEEKNEEWLKRLAMHGVTAILPTLSSHPAEEICRAVEFYSGVMNSPVKGGARVLGVHLEGPFLNFEKKGGINPDYIREPSIEHYKELIGDHPEAVKQITVAPELFGADELITYLKEQGVKVNAGHTNATAEEMRHGIELGVDGVTHFFNAARPISHRDPGLLTEALLTDGVFLEMVSDLVHLAPEIIKLMVKCAGARRISIVTDAVTYSGMPDGHYERCVVVDGSPRLENGTLTGGRYLTDGCVKALIGIGLDPYDVIQMASNTPARRLGVEDIGDIAPSMRADLVAMDENYNILFTAIDGELTE